MFAYGVGEPHLSEDAAFKRIKAARAARRCPAIFEALAQGRVHLSAVVLLAPHVREDTADELLVAATHKSKAEVEQLLAERYPRSEVLAWVEALPPSSPSISPDQQAPGPVETSGTAEPQLSLGTVGERAPGHKTPASFPKLAPLAPERYALQLTMGQGTHDKLRYAQELLGHQIPSGDLAQVLDRALDALIGQLERREFAATTRPRRSRRPTASPRHIPAHVKRAVRERDSGQCTFVGETGRRCPARTRLEFDHVDEVACGGRATLEGIRLRCRAHNQYGAERTFSIEFMRHKREAARDAARRQAEARHAVEAEAETRPAAEAQAHARMAAEDVIQALRVLGFNAAASRRAAALCEAIPQASLEERVKRALSYLCPKGGHRGRAITNLASAP